ncbi:cytochrome P450 [Irpex rosettiformis]|uniref:Cytochrome P450 n=1 Tax=Irpex rosettiformis TaxID=378272 RepID=A0ACB8TP68_9APHY|nr:cytochrome P450 [Irpex rosettiformis]
MSVLLHWPDPAIGNMNILADSIQAIKENVSPSTVALTVVVGAVVIVVYKAGSLIVHNLTSPLRLLPGPPSPHFFWGHGKEIFKEDHSVPQEKWMEQYGPTLSYTGTLAIPRLWTMDTRALNHILAHTYTYQKPSQSRFHLARMVGPGVLVAEEDQHKHQRRVLNPAFGPAQVRELTEIFVEKSQALRDRWLEEIAKSGTGDTHVDAMTWLSKTTLDIIGLAGFNYNFGALNPTGEINELNEAFNTVFTATTEPRVFSMLQGIIPVLRIFTTEESRRSAKAQETMRRIGLELIAEKKASIIAASGQNGVEKKNVVGRDLLTLLIKANMATDIPESQRLSDEEVLAQVPTFIVAGHETTSTATMWALHAFTQHPDVQRKLRDELLTVPTEDPTMDDLQGLPYLEMVVKEVLRHYSPVPMTIRVATHDDLIPCATPYTDRNGVQRDHIRVTNGDVVMIPILALNRYKPYWGEDALEFNPERWEHPPEAITSIPGVFGNILSFIGGPRSCIGYRFSLIEMKALLFTLVRAFEFELEVPGDKIKKRSTIVQRPFIIGDENTKEESKMPLIIRPYIRA